MDSDHVQTKREIVELLTAAGLRPRKRLGQHFLIDGNLMRRLVASAELDPLDLVLEVGGGTGGLTDLIAGRVQQLICVEIDRGLHGVLQERFGEKTGVPVVINTSFNVRGEPIVCTPRDAYKTFVNTGIDAMVIGKYVLTEKPSAVDFEAGMKRSIALEAGEVTAS